MRKIREVLPPHPSLNDLMSMQETYKKADKQQPPPADWVVAEQGKRVLLLDLDKTIIFYDAAKGFYVRPHLEAFFAAVEGLYSIYIFTAANQEYAKMIINELKRRVGDRIKGVLCRPSCTAIGIGKGKTVMVKDIRIATSCSPKDILVVDDAPWSYCLNPENAIRVTAFEGAPDDRELLVLAR